MIPENDTNTPEDCISTAISDFKEKYSLELTKKEELILYELACDDNFDEIAECIINLDDHIIIDPSFSDCEAYNCMLEHLRSNGNTHLCNMIGHIIDSDSYTIKFETGFIPGAEGATRISDLNNKEITVKFHEVDCELSNEDQLAIAETLLHESQHANFYAELIELGLEEYTSAAVKEKWIEYVQQNFDIAYADQHQAMVKEYMESAAEYLWELNDKILTPEHYMKYVWDGLSNVWEGAFPQSTINSWQEKHKELNGLSPYNVNQNTFSCE
jgi:hypothetical protein